MGTVVVEVSKYAENTHEYREKPPSLPTILGIAVPTIVVSRAARAIPNINAIIMTTFAWRVITNPYILVEKEYTETTDTTNHNRFIEAHRMLTSNQIVFFEEAYPVIPDIPRHIPRRLLRNWLLLLLFEPGRGHLFAWMEAELPQR